MTEDGFYNESDFTCEFSKSLISEYGDISHAAQAIHHKCRSERYYNRPVARRTVEHWMSESVGPRYPYKGGMEIAEPADPERMNQVAEMFDSGNIPIDPSIGKITRTKLGKWESSAKNTDTNEIITKTLRRAEVTIEPALPKWRPVSPAPDIAISSYRPLPEIKRGGTERVFIIGDIQVGYFRSQSGALNPFHDEAALEVQLQAIRIFRPHRIVIIGDALDFAELSKYRQDPTFSLTMQPSVDFLYAYLVRVRQLVGPKCAISYIAGNHEARLNFYVVDNAKALYGLRPGGSKPEDWPLMSVPSLLRLDELKIDYSREYPSGEVYLTKPGALRPLLCAHTRPDGRKDRRASVIHGHEVELSSETWSIHTDAGEVSYERWCIPGTGNYGEVKNDKTRPTRTITPSNRARISATQAFALVHIDRKTQDWIVVPVPIRKGARVTMPTGEIIVGDGSLLTLEAVA